VRIKSCPRLLPAQASVLVGFRPISDLQRTRHILLKSRCEKRKCPLFVLNKGRSPHIWSYPIVRAHRCIIDRAAIRNKVVIHLYVPVADLDEIFGCQPIAAPRLNARSIAAYPIAHQEVTIGVEIVIVVVPINVSARAVCNIGVAQGRFDAEIQLWNSGEMGEIETRTKSGAPRSCKGRRIVCRNRIVINGQPFAKQRNAIAEVKTAIAFSRIFVGRFLEVACRAEVG